MRDDKRWIDLPCFDLAEQRLKIALHVGLTGGHRQPFVHERPQRQRIGRPDVGPRH